MSNTQTSKYSENSKFTQLWAVATRLPAEMPELKTSPAEEFNWRRPRCFSSEQLGNLESLTKKFATTLAEKFALFYNNTFDVTITSTTQHFAGELGREITGSKRNDYCLSFGLARENQCGFISVPQDTALSWVTDLLGDSSLRSASPEKEAVSDKDSSVQTNPPQAKSGQEKAATGLTQLEESLLLEIGTTIINALSLTLGLDNNFEQPKAITTAYVPMEIPQEQELCKITFSVRKNGSEKQCQAYLVISCDKLAPAVGKEYRIQKTENGISDSDIIIHHLQQMPVSITAQLARTAISFEELMDIRSCDIVLLEKGVNEPVELMVQNKALFHGRLVKSDGQYAVLITEE